MPRRRRTPRRALGLAVGALLAVALTGVGAAQEGSGRRRRPPPGQEQPVEGIGHLSTFRQALRRVRQTRQGLVRAIHMGDSSIGLDDFPHRLRRRFQRRYGDGGPGFVLLQPHNPGYMNRTTTVENETPWDTLCFIIRRCRRDGHYGLGGAFVESGFGARSRLTPRPRRSVTRAELWYAGHPQGGRVELRFGSSSVELSTRADALTDRWHMLRQPAGRHAVEVRTLGGGRSRAYGVVLENDGPGVVWDTLSMTGAFTNRLLAHDERHFARQLGHRQPDLVVLSYGGNDLRRLVGGSVTTEGFLRETLGLLQRVRRAVPDASCLAIGINDHEASGNFTITPRVVEAVVEAQRRAAQAAGCAFWDTTGAMGGAGSYAVWARRGLAGTDGKHLSSRGREVLAERLVTAVLAP